MSVPLSSFFNNSAWVLRTKNLHLICNPSSAANQRTYCCSLSRQDKLRSTSSLGLALCMDLLTSIICAPLRCPKPRAKKSGYKDHPILRPLSSSHGSPRSSNSTGNCGITARCSRTVKNVSTICSYISIRTSRLLCDVVRASHLRKVLPRGAIRVAQLGEDRMIYVTLESGHRRRFSSRSCQLRPPSSI